MIRKTLSSICLGLVAGALLLVAGCAKEPERDIQVERRRDIEVRGEPTISPEP